MQDNKSDTTVDEFLDDEGSKESTQETTETATPEEQASEVAQPKADDRIQKELSRLRAAQSAADKRAAEAERKRQELEDQQRRSATGNDEVAYLRQVSEENARKASELELKVAVSDLLEEHTDLPGVLRDAIRKNPLGFIGEAKSVPEAVINISNYLTDLKVKNPTTTQEEQPTGKQFQVRTATPRATQPTAKPKSLDQAVDKLLEGGIFS